MGSSSGPLLLADDDDDIRQTLAMLLEDAGFSVTLAANGSEAVAAAAARSYPVAILDVSMPIVDGIQAGRELRRVHPGMWIVMHSSWEEARVRAQFDGFDDFLRKPSIPEALVLKIRRFLAGGPRP